MTLKPDPGADAESGSEVSRGRVQCDEREGLDRGAGPRAAARRAQRSRLPVDLRGHRQRRARRPTARSAASTRRARAAQRIELPSAEAALGRRCPKCGATPTVMCRDTSSRAKRKPAAATIHVARLWLDRACPACRAAPGEPCRTPNGAKAKDIHAARRRPHGPRTTRAHSSPTSSSERQIVLA